MVTSALTYPRHCDPRESGEKQSRATSTEQAALDCFVATLLAMTGRNEPT